MTNNNYMSVDESDIVMLLGYIQQCVADFVDENLIADNLRTAGIIVTDNTRDRFRFVLHNGRCNCGIQFTGYYDNGWYYDLRRYDRYRIIHKERQPAREEIVEYLIILTNAITIDNTIHKPDPQLRYTVSLNQCSLQYRPSVIIKDGDNVVTSCTIRSLSNAKHSKDVDFTGDVSQHVKNDIFNWANELHPVAHVKWKTVAEIVWETICLDRIKHDRVRL